MKFLSDLFLFLPEICLVATLFWIVIGEMSSFNERTRLGQTIALMGLASSLLQAFIFFRIPEGRNLGGVLLLDRFALFLK